MNFSTTNGNGSTKELLETLNAENAALVESTTSVYYQAYIAKKELANERSRANAVEKELVKAEKEKVRLTDSYKELCQTLRTERAEVERQEVAITTLKTRWRKSIIFIIVLVFFLAGSAFGSVMLVRWGHSSRSLIMELRETSHAIPEMSEMSPDDIRYSYEEMFHEKW